MEWTDCGVIEVVPGRMSGAPVPPNARVCPEDLLDKIEQAPEWVADAFGLPLRDVREVLSFYALHEGERCQADCIWQNAFQVRHGRA